MMHCRIEQKSLLLWTRSMLLPQAAPLSSNLMKDPTITSYQSPSSTVRDFLLRILVCNDIILYSCWCKQFYLIAVQFPSPYVMYKFYSFPDYDTAIIQHSTSPHYVDIRTFPLSMAPQLDQYLKSEVKT